MTEYVDFEIVSTENSQITLKGYPFDFAEKEHMQYHQLIHNWAEDSQFLQWIWDCKDDGRRTIDRKTYYLIINTIGR